jgi:nucleoside-diphosphate-sugar epimerase
MIVASREPAATGTRFAGVPALVLGGSGFIGGWVARALSAHGALVHATVRDRAGANRLVSRAGNVEVVEADLSIRGVATRLLTEVRPSVVFNLAGFGVDRTERDTDAMAGLNANLVVEVCEALVDLPADQWPGMRLVQVGSALEYGRIAGPIREASEPNPSTDYGRTKLAGTRAVEYVARSRGLRALAARLFTVYGPGEHADRLLPSIRRAAVAGERVHLTQGLQRRDFTFVEDVAEGLLRLAVSQANPGEVVNLASGRLTTVREFACTAASVLGLEPSRLQFGALPDRPEEMWQDEVDVSHLQALTGWLPPTSIKDGIRRTNQNSDGP